MCWVGGRRRASPRFLRAQQKGLWLSWHPGTVCTSCWFSHSWAAHTGPVALGKSEKQSPAAAKTRNWPKIFMGSSRRVVRVTRNPRIPAPTGTLPLDHVLRAPFSLAKSKSIQLLFFSCVFAGLRQMSHTFGVTSGPRCEQGNELLLLEVLPGLSVAQIKVWSYTVNLTKSRVCSCETSLYRPKAHLSCNNKYIVFPVIMLYFYCFVPVI